MSIAGPEALALHAEPDFADPLGGQFAVAPLGMNRALERIERDLPHHRVDHVLDLAGEQRLALLGALGLRQQPLEGQHLAEHAGGLRQRQRRRRHQRAVLGRQHLMHAVAEFMGERHHVARLALIIHQHIGMRRRRGRMRERARRLARPHRRIDPAIGEKPLGDVGHLGRETAIGRQHHVPARPARRCCRWRQTAAAHCGPNARASSF